MKRYKRLIKFLLLSFIGCATAYGQTTEKYGRSFWDAIPVPLSYGDTTFTDVRNSYWYDYSSYPYYDPESSELYQTYGNAVFYRLNIEYTSDITIHNWDSPEVNCTTLLVVTPQDPYAIPYYSYNCDSVRNVAWFLGGEVANLDSLNAPPDTSRALAYLHVKRLRPGTYYIITAGSFYTNGSIPNGLVRTTITASICPFIPDETDYTSNYNSISTMTPTVAGKTAAEFTTTGTYSLQTQYYDGLGRPVQQLSYRSSSNKENIVQRKEYDIFGRDWRQWLPTPYKSKSIPSFVAEDNLKHESGIFYKDSCAYEYTIYENSPLNRQKEYYGAGKTWHESGHSVKNSYRINTAADNCLQFYVSGSREHPMLSFSGRYGASNLSIVEKLDEDSLRTSSFTNELGHITLERSIIDNDTLDTYYVHDDYGNLCFVLPPAVSDYLPSLYQTGKIVQDTLDKYAYQYRYDYRNQCIAKKLPGCDWTEMIYDRGGRILFSQDGNQRQQGQWVFRFIDLFDRVVLSGVYRGTLNQQNWNASNVYATFEPENISSQYGYVIHGTYGIKLDSLQVLQANYYDTYDYKNYLSGFNTSLNYQAYENYGKQYVDDKDAQLHTKGWLTGSVSCILDTDKKLNGCYYYDYYHNLIQTRNTDLNGETIVGKSAFNFRGQPTVTSKEYGTDIDIRKNYLYDHAERLVKESHSVGEKTTHFAYSYDELGKIRGLTRIHGKDSLTTTNEYNIRDWLIRTNSPAFKQQLHYTDGIGTPYYNGNISSMTWQSDSEEIRGYRFSYDELSRIKNAIYGEGENLGLNSGNYNEQVTDYDKMGNIRGLLRYGQISESNYGLLDNLHLTYDGNCLQAVYDNATNQAFGKGMEFKNGANETVEYEYDRNGNLTKDLNKKISDIQYNILNLPSLVLFEDGNSISYIYDANGMKIQTRHIIENDTTVTEYIGSAIYENGVLTKLLTNQGYITLADTIYHYYIQDHQGNNRTVVTQDGTVEEVNHYYPLGGLFASTSNVQPYKYNGKKWDRKGGLDWYDYGARMYDPVLGRWHVMDTSSEKFYSFSPYNYCLDNPIKHVDPDGNQPRPVRPPVRRGYRNGGRPNPYALYPGGIKPQSYVQTTSMSYRGNGTRQIVPMEPQAILQMVNTPGGNEVQMSGNNSLGIWLSGIGDLSEKYKEFRDLLVSFATTVTYASDGIIRNSTEIVINDPDLAMRQLEYEAKAKELEKSLGELDFTGKTIMEIVEMSAERKKIIESKLGLSPKEIIQTELYTHPERFQSVTQVRRIIPEIIQK